MVCQHTRPSIRARLTRSTPYLGVIVDLFFRCMSALLHPVDRTRMRIRWGLVVYTVVMFSFATIFTAMTFEVQSISYVDNRKFPGFPFPDSPLGTSSTFLTRGSSLLPRCLTLATPLALSLLCSLCHELSGHCTPMPNVPCFFGCAFKSSISSLC